MPYGRGDFASIGERIIGTSLAVAILAMPSVLHEVLRELFAKRPDLLAPLLEKRLSLPSPKLVALDSEQTDARLKPV